MLQRAIVIAICVSCTSEGGKYGNSKYPDADEMPPQVSNRIIGGKYARPHEFPSQVALDYKCDPTRVGCEGSIINERWILTAGHCYDGVTVDKYIIVVGENNRSAASTARRIMKAEAIYMHENFTWLPIDVPINKITLVKLATPIEFNENIRPVCAQDPENFYEHVVVQQSGWGDDNVTIAEPDTLRYITLTTMTPEECNKTAFAFGMYVTDSMICSVDHKARRSPCHGDSGGPETVKEKYGTFRLTDIASWICQPFCQPGDPNVYTRVTSFNDWILNKIHNY